MCRQWIEIISSHGDGMALLKRLNMDPSKTQQFRDLIPDVKLTEGYTGKILLVLVQYKDEKKVVLRSDDIWPQLILNNARTEVTAAGFPDATVDELGGAHLFFRENKMIEISGTSEQYGTCDLDYAAQLVRAAWPGWNVVVYR